MKQFCKKIKLNHNKGKAFDRKGLGMELALLVLLVTFACSTLLMSSALMGRDTLNAREADMKQQILLDELAERVLTYPNDLPESERGGRFADYAYTYERNQGEGGVLIIKDAAGQDRLTVRVSPDNEIIEWTYH